MHGLCTFKINIKCVISHMIMMYHMFIYFKVNEHHEMRQTEEPVICQLVVDWASQKIDSGETVEDLTKTDLVRIKIGS